MANVESQSVDHQRFRIHIGGRTLPTSPPDTDDSQSSSHESRYEILQTENALAEMSQFLEKQLRQRVLTGESILNAITIKQAVERYAAQIRRLNEFCNEWLTMLAGIIHIGGSAEGKGSDGLVSERLKTEVESWRADLLHEAKADGFISESIVTAKLAAKPLPEFKRELSEHIEASVVRTKGTMLEQLVNLVDREVLGDRKSTRLNSSH